MSRFAVRLGLVAAAGLALRMVFTVVTRRDAQPFGDDLYYHWQGVLFAKGHWFIDPIAFVYLDGEVRPSAAHPPGYGLFLGLWSWLGVDTPLGHRLASCLLGATLIVVVGLVARRLAGDRAGLIAAGLAAIYPNLWINDAQLMAESLYALTIAGVLWAAYGFWTAPGPRSAVLLGVMLAAATLTRAEAVTLFVLLAVPLALVLRGVARNLRLRLLGVVLLTGALLVGPWMLANLLRFQEPALLGTGAGQVTAIGSCDRTFSGEYLGYWSADCALHDWPYGCDGADAVARQDGDESIPACDESVVDEAAREQGLDYLREHTGRVPVVVAARVGRAWDVFRPFQGVELNDFFESRGYWPPRLGLGMYAMLLLLGAIGLWRLWQRRITIVPFVALAAMITVTAAISFGITRYRVPIDVALPILAAIAITSWWRPAESSPPESLPEDTPAVPAPTP